MIGVHQMCYQYVESEAEPRGAMPHRDDDDHVGDADSRDVAVCVQTLNHTIGQLANCHGAAAVVAALTEVMGCSSCMSDVSCGRGIRALMKQIDVIR
jgi:hypothetical protein